MTVQNTSSLLDGPEGEPRPTTGPELKQCVRCDRIGTRAYRTTQHGTFCTNFDACTARLLGT